MFKKRCEMCGKSFMPKQQKVTHCSYKCSRETIRIKSILWWDKNKANFSAKQKERLSKRYPQNKLAYISNIC